LGGRGWVGGGNAKIEAKASTQELESARSRKNLKL